MSMFSDESFAIGVAVAILVLYLMLLLGGLVCYIISSIGLHKLGNRRMVPNAWMAWLPFARTYLFGRIVDAYDGKNGIKRRWRAVLLTMELLINASVYVGYFAMLGWIISSGLTEATEAANMMEPVIIKQIIGLVVGVYGWLIIVAIFSSIYTTCRTICLYKIYESTVPKRAVTYLILSLLVPMAESFCLFACRNKGYSVEPAPYPVYTAPQPVVNESQSMVESQDESIFEEE